jgi:Dolichyl-phosphate-mannose-protein mannosyltransferase
MVVSRGMNNAVHEDKRARDEVWPLFFLLSLAAIFFFSYFNRFAGLRSGDGEYSGGLAFLAGRLPYRDYYTAGPPLNPMKSALILAIFGKTLLVTRLVAVVERLAIAALLYAWLRRIFSSWASAIAALVTIIVSAGDHTDPLASYNHDAIFFAMLCGLLACLSLEDRRRRQVLIFAALAGVAAGFSSLTKQTVGLGSAVAVLVLGAVAVLRLHGVKRSAGWALAYLGGFAVPVLALGIYLYRLGLLRSCLTMLFVSGPSAKASAPHAFLGRELAVAADNPAWVIPALIAVVLSARAVWGAVKDEKLQEDRPPIRWLILWLVALLIIGSAMALDLTKLPALNDFSKCSVYYTLVAGSVLGIVAIGYGLRSGRAEERIWQILLFAGVGWSVAVTLSLSWPAFEAMALPGLGLLIAAALEGSRHWGRRFLCLVLTAMVFLAVREKLDLPFSFDHQDELAVRLATQTSAEPLLRGMRLPPETVRLLDETVSTMRTKAGVGDTVFTYPEMGLLYALSGRNPPTWSGSHNIDVVPDSFAREEAERILRARPAVILYARPSETDLRLEEKVWRNGRPSGQRDIVSALDKLVTDYQLVDTFCLQSGDNPIRLYVRRSP